MFQEAFKTVVVGVDFSPYSKVVVKQAKLLSQLWNTKLVLVHAIHDPVEYSPSLYMSFPNVISEKSYEERIKKMYEIKNSSAKIIAKRGTPASLLQETARKFPKPLIIAGHKGQSKILDFFFGSTAQILALKSKIPVWIHRGNKVIKPAKVLVPHDLSLQSNHAVDIVKKMSLAAPLSYEVFYVREKVFPVLDYKTYLSLNKRLIKKTQTKISNLLKSYPQLPFIATNGEVTDKLVKRTKKFDLLVMAHHNPTGLFSKSETADLMKQVKTPIIVTH